MRPHRLQAVPHAATPAGVDALASGKRRTNHDNREVRTSDNREGGTLSREGTGTLETLVTGTSKGKPPGRTLGQGTQIGRVHSEDLLILTTLGSVEQKGLHVIRAGNWVIYHVFVCQANTNKNHSNYRKRRILKQFDREA